MSSSSKDNSFRFSIDELEATLEHPTFMGAKLKVPTDKLAARYFNTTKKDSGLLPPVVRYTSPDFTGFIVERPPTTVRIEFKSVVASMTGQSIPYYLPLPWMIYALKFNTPELKKLDYMYVFGRNEPIFSEDDKLYFVPIPNIWKNGYACQGKAAFADFLWKLGEGSDTNTAVNGIINHFWQSGFNMDIGDWLYKGLPEYFKEALGTLQDNATSVMQYWAELSPAELLDVAFKELDRGDTGSTLHTVGDVIKQLSCGNNIENIGGGRPLLLYLRSLAMAALND